VDIRARPRRAGMRFHARVDINPRQCVIYKIALERPKQQRHPHPGDPSPPSVSMTGAGIDPSIDGQSGISEIGSQQPGTAPSQLQE
jgi:hypothetical protein